jgi:TonB family protein
MPQAGESLQSSLVGCKFQLIRYLGGSQRSAVFLTERQQGQPRTAAIKLIPADPASADIHLSRWKLISKLSHPHLLRIFETGRCQQDGEDLLYVVMEYAEENLAQILSTHTLTSDEADAMLKPALETLAYLHNRGLVHGHLKPTNIVVAGERLKLSSDGICRIGETDGAGTGTYAPPEPPGTEFGPARDVWSLGVTVVQALTQLLPVPDGKEQQALVLPETLPPRFAELARNCLERDPQRRCTLPEIAEHLQYTLPAPVEQVVARQQVPNRAQKTARQNRYALPALTFIVLLMALVGGVKLFNRRSSQQAPSTIALEQPKPSEPAPLAGTDQPSPQLQRDAGMATGSPSLRSSARAALKTTSEVRNVAPQPSLGTRATSASGSSGPGEIIQRVLPDVPRNAANTIRGTVRVTVRVRVDPAGNVSVVNLVSAGPSVYFARLALDAARRWRFSPARRDGRAIPSAWTLRFEFIRGATRVIPIAAG